MTTRAAMTPTKAAIINMRRSWLLRKLAIEVVAVLLVTSAFRSDNYLVGAVMINEADDP